MKTAVLKISGKTIQSFIDSSHWIKIVSNLRRFYDGVVIVHGAGKHISEWGEKLGFKSEFIDGQRITSKKYMEVVAAVQSGLVNTQITAKLNSCGIISAGFSGIDFNLFSAESSSSRLGYVGKPKQIGSSEIIHELISRKILPVFSSVCRNGVGDLMNVNADIFTEVLAAALKADTVFFVSDMPGVLIDGSAAGSLSPSGITEGITNGEITGGMIPKLNSASLLLGKGIKKIWIGSRLTDNDLLVSDGTWITVDESENLSSVA